jgi:hypothetical protein
MIALSMLENIPITDLSDVTLCTLLGLMYVGTDVSEKPATSLVGSVGY